MTRGRQVQRSLPPRLSIEEHFSQQLSPMRVYHQVARQPVSVHWHEFYEVHFILASQGTHLLNGFTHQLVRLTHCGRVLEHEDEHIFCSKATGLT